MSRKNRQQDHIGVLKKARCHAERRRASARAKDLRRRVSYALLAITMLISFGWSARAADSSQSSEALPAGPMQAKATTACAECHEARIIVQQRLTKAAWAKEVDKMIKWGALVDSADHDALVDYLSANFGPDQPPYKPRRSSVQKSGLKNKAK